MKVPSFDLVVIGSGPGGCRAAVQAAKLGKSVAVVERGGYGGYCVHTGTIPSKTLREVASRGGSFKDAFKRMRAVQAEEAAVVEAQLRRNKVQIFTAEASFVDAHVLELAAQGKKATRIRGEHILIATGSTPNRPADIPFGRPGVYDSDSILGLKKAPKTVLVIGAGVIGCEYASIFAHLGAKVTIADRRKELLRAVDAEAAEGLSLSLKAKRVDFVLGQEFSGFFAKGSAKLKWRVGGRVHAYDAVLVCMGRSAVTSPLGLGRAGVALDTRGNIPVDADFRTNVPHVYAVGDVIGVPGLAAAASEQGRIAASRMFGLPCPAFPESFPYGIYTIPEISLVGKREDELTAANVPFVAGRARFKELARGIILGDHDGFVKLLVHRETRKILGVHVLGSTASELVHIGQAAMALGAPVDFLVDNVFNYPTLAEAYKVAALQVVNQLGR